MKIQTTIYMEPKGKDRARTIMRDSKVWSYTPRETAQAEEFIRLHILNLRKFFQPGVPIKLIATFFLSRPKKTPWIKMPVRRPDLDNMVKLLLDSLERGCYNSDSQVTTAIVKKRFGMPPRIELLLEEDQNEKALISDAGSDDIVGKLYEL